VQSNFAEAVALLEAALPKAEFVAIDCEMTGIRGKPEMWLDSPQLRYSKLKFIASRYKLIQVGVAVFYVEDGHNKCLPLNFYVFPRDPSEKVILEVGAVAFNRKNDMDFNKWIYEGIHYIDEAGEAQLRNKVYSSEVSNEIVLSRPYDIEMFREITDRVQAWYLSEETELEIHSLNAFHRKYFYQRVMKDFPDIITETMGDSKTPTLKLKKESLSSQGELKEERQRVKFEEGLGFRRVFKMLTASKKPLVGHSLLIDLMFIYASFKGRLPYHFAEFQALLHEDFPEVYDTRHMFLTIPGFREQFEAQRLGASLTEIHEYISKTSELVMTLALGCEKYLGKKAHEAAYDAFVTGELFLMFRSVVPDFTIYRNLLSLYRSLFTIKLEGGTVLPEGKVLVIKGQDLEAKLEGFKVQRIGDSIALLLLDVGQDEPTELLSSKGIEAADLESQLLQDEVKGSD